jgi:hypothetical protein
MATTDIKAIASVDPVAGGLGRRSSRHSPPEPVKGCNLIKC